MHTNTKKFDLGETVLVTINGQILKGVITTIHNDTKNNPIEYGVVMPGSCLIAYYPPDKVFYPPTTASMLHKQVLDQYVQDMKNKQTFTAQCECGSLKAGTLEHSSWCPLF